MQSALNTATSLAQSAAIAVGLTSPPAQTAETDTRATDAITKNNNQNATKDTGDQPHRQGLPADGEAGMMKKMNSEGLAVFEDEGVRHEVLVKINKLAKEDIKHGLREVAELELVIEGEVKKGISYYHPLRYFTVTRPMGIEYFGEIEIEEGKCIHVRCHKPSAGAKATYHSIDTRPSNEGGAVFKTGEPLGWFDY